MASTKIYALENQITNYEVNVQEAILLQPAQAVAEHRMHFLANLDLLFAHTTVALAVIYTGNGAPNMDDDPVKVLKEALQKVLVPFYPVAGRVGICPDQGKLIVECTGEGVSFVEADADIELAQLGDLTHPNCLNPFIYPIPAVDRPPLLTAQVTRFKCGGFVLGLMFSHSIFDGVGCVEFATAWAETARGLPISMLPELNKACLKARSPLQIKFPHHEFLDLSNSAVEVDVSDEVEITYRCFGFTETSVEMVKKKALQEEGVISECTTFEAVAGFVWRARAIAMHCMGVRPEQKIKLLFAVDGRSKETAAALPKGYIGNAIALGCALASVQELKENPLSHAVKHVQGAKARVSTEEYMRSCIDYMEREGGVRLPSAFTLHISSWTRLQFKECDFGWGKATHFGPALPLCHLKEVPVFYPGENNKCSLNLVLGLSPKAMDEFSHVLHAELLY